MAASEDSAISKLELTSHKCSSIKQNLTKSTGALVFTLTSETVAEIMQAVTHQQQSLAISQKYREL